MKILVAPTEDFIKGQRTYLAAAAVAGSDVVISVDNGTGFNVNDYIVVGQEGSQDAELCQISAVTETSITVATLAQAHAVDEIVTQYRYNQRNFYGCTTATGTFTQLTSYGSPVTIAVNDPQGTTLEYTGGEGYLYFKATYWNSFTSTETDINDATAGLADESLRYCGIFAIRKQAGLTQNAFVSDGEIENYRKQAENEINSYISDRYVLPLAQQTSGLPEVPWMVNNICKLLAAGYLDYREYGGDGQGVKWLGEARGLLKALRIGTQKLLGTDNMELIVQTKSSSVQSYPNRKSHDGRGPTQMFDTNQKF
jgi:phage gp36-like protein/uncharacterized protein YqfB (UPF0267 family)